MKNIFLLAVLFIFILTSCKDDDFTYAFPELSQHLVTVTATTDDWEHQTKFVYDSLNRISEIQGIYADEQTYVESYTYNDVGKISQKVNESYTTNYVYNAAGQVIEENVSYVSPYDGDMSFTKTKYLYKNGKISKGIEYSEEGEVVSYISYKYDSRGNTLEKIVRSASSPDIILYEIRFRYDNKINPLGLYGISTLNGYVYSQNADIVQVNNPTYLSYLNSFASSLPPEFDISYEYNSADLPETAIMDYVRYPEHEGIDVLFEYESVED